MSNSGRPSVQRKQSRASEKKRDGALDVGVSLKVDGTTYTVRNGDLTSLDTMALRRETGLSFVALMQAFVTSPDIDLVAALVWLARRIDGEQMLPYAVVAQDIDYDAEIEVVGEPGEETDPEA